ncbi:MAG: polysaccharide biosynthesis tyrosine autokinase [Paludibacteraceae bacterium]|nr:polysaccharide biosynthesis tyrosine autokinase [Paludibacteraceae bacterium]
MVQGNQEIDIRSWIIRILKNWYWVVLSCFISGIVGGLMYFSKTPKFIVDSKIMLRASDDENSFMPQSELMGMMGVGGMKNTADEVEILSSRDHVMQIVKELDVQSIYRKKDMLRWKGQYPNRDISVNYPPQFLDTINRGVRVSVKVRKDDYLVRIKFGKIGRSRHVVKDLSMPLETCVGLISFDVNRPSEIKKGDRFKIVTLPLLVAVNEYKKAFEAAPIKKESNVIAISSVTDMPSLARDFITMEIELYNRDAVEDKNLIANSTAVFLADRLDVLKRDLVLAEANIAKYQEQHKIVNFATEAELSITEETEYRKGLAEIETQLHLIEFVSEFLSDSAKTSSIIPTNLGLSSDALVGAIQSHNNLVLRRMRLERTAAEENPLFKQIDMQLALVNGNIEASLDNVRRTLLIRKEDLQVRYNISMQGLANIPSVRLEYIEMAREKQIKEQLYVFLSRQREENALTLASSITPAKIIAKPQVNPDPVSPRSMIYGLFFLMLGLASPIAVMYIYDLMNNRISHDSKEFEKKIKIPFVGVLVRNHSGEHIAVREGENSVSAELFRTLRTNIRFMQPVESKCSVILVTSSINGEGKSYVATNLAISQALLGKKIVLVGLDIRKPMLATYLNLPSQGCLTSYLADNAYSLEDIIIPSSTKNFDVIPAGIIPPNPSELLQSDRLDALFEKLRKLYDCVIIDSAPVALVSDTFLLNRVADMTIYVSRANYTTFDLIDFLNQSHEQNRLPNMVSVLNGVDAKKIGYGYGYGYGHHIDKKKKWWQLKKA